MTFTLLPSNHKGLQAIVADPKLQKKHVWRARIVLLIGEGVGTNAVVAATRKSKPCLCLCLWRWQERFMHEGVVGFLFDRSRPPGIAPIAQHRVAEIVRLTHEQPPHESTHWTLRAIANVAASTVQGIWKAHGFTPHRWLAIKLSNDPAFVQKLTDIVGLYVAPLDGTVIGQNIQRHRHQEFIRFLDRLEPELPAGKVVHVILDNHAADKTNKVKDWLAKHPRWTFHSTPTLSSWLNAVEGFLAKLTRRRLKHRNFRSVCDGHAAINRFVAERNANDPKPILRRADPGAIGAARNRGFQTLKLITKPPPRQHRA